MTNNLSFMELLTEWEPDHYKAMQGVEEGNVFSKAQNFHSLSFASKVLEEDEPETESIELTAGITNN